MNPNNLILIIKAGAAMLLLTPFVKNMGYYFPFVGPKGLWLMAGAEIIFFTWLILAAKWERYRPNFKNPVIFSMLFFMAAMLASAVFGVNFSASFWSKFERMGGVLMFFHLTALALALYSVLNQNDWKKLFCGSVAVSVLIGIQALFDLSASSRGGGFIGNDSFWGTYILFNIFIAAYLFLAARRDRRKNLKIFAGASFLVLVFCLFAQDTQIWTGIASGHFEMPRNGLLRDIVDSGARAAKISFLAGMALMGVLWLATRNQRALKKLGATILLLSVSGAVTVIFLAASQGNPVNRLMTEKFGQGAVHGRLVVWEIAWKGFLEKPILGWGPENFNFVFARHYNPCLGTPECSGAIWYDRAHNIILDSLVDGGLAGFIGYFSVFAAALFVLWNFYRAHRFAGAAINQGNDNPKFDFSGNEAFPEAAAFTALFAAYFLQNLTVFDMVVSYMMWFFCLSFIAGLYEPARFEKKAWPNPVGAAVIFPSMIVAAFCFYFFIFCPQITDMTTVRAAAEPNAPQRLALYRQALEFSPMGKYQIRLFFSNNWTNLIEEKDIKKYITPEQTNEIYSFLAAELEKSGREAPLDFQSRLELGRLYNSWSLIDKSKLVLAEKSLKEAMEISPRNQQSYWDLAQTRIYQSNFDEAAALARQARDLYPASKRAQEVVSEVERIKKQLPAPAK